MSRSTLVLLIVLIVILLGAFALSRVNTEVAPTQVEKPVANEALAH